VWQRYLGKVGKFYGTLWLMYIQDTAYQFLSKSVGFCRS